MRQSLTIQLTSQVESNDVTMVVTDVLGRVLIEQQISVALGINSYELDINKLADATYFIGFTGIDAIKEAKKFVKLAN